MFIEVDELKNVMYEYQLDQIIEGDQSIALKGIAAGVAKVKSYLTSNNQKRYQDGRPQYDVDKIFSQTGDDRDALIVRICLTVAAWYVCELANIDIVYNQLKERYESEIDFLSMVAGVGKYANSPTISLDLPTVEPDTDGSGAKQIFRYGSRPAFNHE